MKGSLVSREVIADSIELFVRSHAFDAVVAICGCDKTIPGTVMALARLNLPGLSLYGGSIMAGQFHGHDVTIQDVFEAVGAFAAGKMTEKEVCELEDQRVPGRGRLRRPIHRQHHGDGDHFSRNFADGRERSARRGPAQSANCVRLREAGDGASEATTSARSRSSRTLRFENAIASVAATGGSTNAVLHLLAIARDAGVPLTIDEFDKISAKTPVLADLKPGGRFTAPDMYHAGGMRLLGKHLQEAGLLHDGKTASGQKPFRGDSQKPTKRRGKK